MDAQQDVTLGEIYRSVQRIDHNVNGLMVQHAETREQLAGHESRLGHVERMKAHRPSCDVISVKSLIGLILAIGTVVGGLVTAYFKATQ